MFSTPPRSAHTVPSRAGSPSSSSRLTSAQNHPISSASADVGGEAVDGASPPSVTAPPSLDGHPPSEPQLTKSALGLTDEANHLVPIKKSSPVNENGCQQPLGIKKSGSIPKTHCESKSDSQNPVSSDSKSVLSDVKPDSVVVVSPGPGKQKVSVTANCAPLPASSAPAAIKLPTPVGSAGNQSSTERHHKRAKLESLPLPRDHLAASAHTFQTETHDLPLRREDSKFNKVESLRSDVVRDSIQPPPLPQKYHANLPPSAPRTHDYSYHRSSYASPSSHHSLRGTPSSPASYRAPLSGAPMGSRTNLPIGPRSWSSHKMPVTGSTIPGNAPPINPLAKEPTKYSHPGSNNGTLVPERVATREGFSPKAHLNTPFNPSSAHHPKVPSDTNTPPHIRGGLISGPTLNTPASEVFKSPLPLSIPITIPPPAPPPPPPHHSKSSQPANLTINPMPQPGSTTPKALLQSGSLSPTVNFNKPNSNPLLGSTSPSSISANHTKTISSGGPNNSSLRNELIGNSPINGHLASNGFHGLTAPSINTSTGPSNGQQFRVNNYPSPKNFVVYSNPPGYPTPNNQPAILGPGLPGPGGLVGGPPPPPPVLIDKDFERAQRMLDVCPGMAQEIAKLRSTRNSSMLSSHLSTEISTQKALMDLHWQSSEFKTMAERRKLADSQLEKSGGGVSLGMGF
ncbi:hypothetical protein H4Q26_002746 [Puccinia striiformis f. sp. tritici PST-130]|nr:hypothetical protein H4Q26_002746 [Puccinia striiformis f. sp. tritici PST-130]